MTPEQALSILDQAASSARLSRNEHLAVQQAVQVLSMVVAQSKPPEPRKDQA